MYIINVLSLSDKTFVSNSNVISIQIFTANLRDLLTLSMHVVLIKSC